MTIEKILELVEIQRQSGVLLRQSVETQTAIIRDLLHSLELLRARIERLEGARTDA